MNYKLYTCYHKDSLINDYNLINDKYHILYPTHKKTNEIDINYLHDCLSDICAMYYVWKNKKYCDFVGFEHYRRRFNISKIPNLNNDECYVRNYEYNMGFTIKKQYIKTLGEYDWHIYMNILNNLFGKNNYYVDYLTNSCEIIWDDIFIMPYNKFELLCKLLFTVFDNFNKITKINYNLNNYKKFYNNNDKLYRPHIYERLISAFIFKNFSKEKIFKEDIY